jgi:peroxiredoxin
MVIAVGDRAPDASLVAPDGSAVSLASFRGRKTILLLLRGLW